MTQFRKQLFRIAAVMMAAFLLSTFCGCASGIESRIAERPEVFQAYSTEMQTRIRSGRLWLGDDQDAVWFVYGEPTEKIRRMDETGNAEIWIYKILGYNTRTYPAVRPVYRDVRGTLRKSYYIDDTPEYEWQEVRRIEFRDGHITAVQIND